MGWSSASKPRCTGREAALPLPRLRSCRRSPPPWPRSTIHLGATIACMSRHAHAHVSREQQTHDSEVFQDDKSERKWAAPCCSETLRLCRASVASNRSAALDHEDAHEQEAVRALVKKLRAIYWVWVFPSWRLCFMCQAHDRRCQGRQQGDRCRLAERTSVGVVTPPLAYGRHASSGP